MRAAVFDSRSSPPGGWVSIEDLPRPQPQPGEVLLKVIACGVCRTDLHIVEGDLPPIRAAHHPRSSDRRRGGGRRNSGSARWNARRRLLDGRG